MHWNLHIILGYLEDPGVPAPGTFPQRPTASTTSGIIPAAKRNGKCRCCAEQLLRRQIVSVCVCHSVRVVFWFQDGWDGWIFDIPTCPTGLTTCDWVELPASTSWHPGNRAWRDGQVPPVWNWVGSKHACSVPETFFLVPGIKTELY
jgi:hypothetical protein